MVFASLLRHTPHASGRSRYIPSLVANPVWQVHFVLAAATNCHWRVLSCSGGWRHLPLAAASCRCVTEPLLPWWFILSHVRSGETNTRLSVHKFIKTNGLQAGFHSNTFDWNRHQLQRIYIIPHSQNKWLACEPTLHVKESARRTDSRESTHE